MVDHDVSFRAKRFSAGLDHLDPALAKGVIGGISVFDES